MNELGRFVKALASLSWRYNTFRGRWTDMPESIGLCIVLGILRTGDKFAIVWI